MEESKELQGFYKIFRAVIYISVLMEFFEYAIDPRAIDGFGGVVCDLHDRIKQWFIYHDGNLVYSKVVTFLLVCITCVGTRNKKPGKCSHERSHQDRDEDIRRLGCTIGGTEVEDGGRDDGES